MRAWSRYWPTTRPARPPEARGRGLRRAFLRRPAGGPRAPAATPGGGTAAALAAGLACALVERCATAAGRADDARRAAELRPLLVAIAEDDVAAVVAGGSGPPRRLRAAAAELAELAALLEREGPSGCAARPASRASWPRRRGRQRTPSSP